MRNHVFCALGAFVLSVACNAQHQPVANGALPTGAVDVQAQVAHRQGAGGLPSFVWIARDGLPRFESAHDAATFTAKGLRRVFSMNAEAVDAVKLTDVQASGLSHVARFEQRIDGVEIFRSSLNILLNRDFEPISASGLLSPTLTGRHKVFALTESDALVRAQVDLVGHGLSATMLDVDGDYHRFSLAGLSQPARVKRVWFPHTDVESPSLTPAFYVEMMFASGPAWSFVIAADSGDVLFRNNLVKNDAFTYRVYADPKTLMPMDGPQGFDMSPHPTGQIDGKKLTMVPSQLVTLSSFPFSKTNDPWLAPDATQTKGNNVDAYSDSTGGNGFDATDIRAALSAPLTFDYTYQSSQQPGANATQMQASVTQMFYVTNFMHDWFYDSGFNETAGNHQLSNYGRGGKQNDPILAEVQDSSGRNNANAATPADGASPRIQMYIFSGTSDADLTVNSPSAIAGKKQVGLASGFGKDAFQYTGDVALADDAQGTDSADACEPVVSNLTGKIALVHRGICSFLQKAQNAQAAGATGVIIANVASSSSPTQAPFMGGTGLNVTVPVLSLNLADGQALEAAIASGANVTMRRELLTDLDGALDTSVVSHEWGHTLSNRLIGNGNGLTNNQAGGLGEGWSDFVALLVMASEDDLKVPSNANWNGVYANGAYAMSGSGADLYFGIRRLPYSVDFTKNALTFKHIQNGNALPANVPTSYGEDGSFNSEVHSTGEVWATMLWECYVGLLRDTRHTFVQAQDLMKKYLVASLKLTPVEPTLLEARDALLAATYANDEGDFVTFLKAFARRGAGVGATGPSKESVDNSVVKESYYAGNAVSLVDASLSDDAVTCDHDGFLDDGETGTVKVTIRNGGIGTLTSASAKFSSTFPGLSFANGGNVAVGALKPFETKVITNAVHLRGSLVQDAKITVTVTDPGIEAGRSLEVPVISRNNVDEVADAATIDHVDTRETSWLVSRDRKYPTTPGWVRAGDDKNRWWTVPNSADQSDHWLSTPDFSVGAEPFTLAFKHRWSFRFSTRRNVDTDGGVLEVSVDSGKTWRDVSEVGTPDYNTTLDSSSRATNPLKGKKAYGNKSAGYPDAWIDSKVEIKLDAPSDTVRIRFRAATGLGFSGAPGWDVDDISLTGITTKPFWARVEHHDWCDDQAPVANAGNAQSVPENVSVALSGSGSDPAGAALSYEWVQLAGPNVSLSGETTAAPTFTSPHVTEAVTLTFGLRVSNGTLLSPSSHVDVTVDPLGQATGIGGGGCAYGGRDARVSGFATVLSLLALVVSLRRRNSSAH